MDSITIEVKAKEQQTILSGKIGPVPPEKVSRRQVTLKTEVSTHQQAKLKNLVSSGEQVPFPFPFPLPLPLPGMLPQGVVLENKKGILAPSPYHLIFVLSSSALRLQSLR